MRKRLPPPPAPVATRETCGGEREAIIGRLELHYSFQDLADALGRPSADAARKFVQRAVVRLAELMGADG